MTGTMRVLGGCMIAIGFSGWVLGQQESTTREAEHKPAPKTIGKSSAKVVKTELAKQIQRESIKKKPAKPAHTPPQDLLNRLLTRLHKDALQHFYSDPQLGFSRMPVVFQKMQRLWVLPKFSPGDLGSDEPIPNSDAMQRIHAGTLQDFSSPRPATTKPAFNFLPRNARSFDRSRKIWEARSVDLVGLLMHKQPVVYVSSGDMHKKSKSKTRQRPLDEFEASGLGVLESGKELYARSGKGVIRLLGAVRARKSCIACHTDRKEDDLFGAFSYTLREAKYTRRPGRRRMPFSIPPTRRRR